MDFAAIERIPRRLKQAVQLTVAIDLSVLQEFTLGLFVDSVLCAKKALRECTIDRNRELCEGLDNVLSQHVSSPVVAVQIGRGHRHDHHHGVEGVKTESKETNAEEVRREDPWLEDIDELVDSPIDDGDFRSQIPEPNTQSKGLIQVYRANGVKGALLSLFHYSHVE